MPRLLHLDASARVENSHSRRVTKEFVDAYVAAHPGTDVIYRDLGSNPPPAVDDKWVNASLYGLVDQSVDQNSPEAQATLALSNELVKELQDADIYVAGVPMYNFGVPGAFKNYIDQVVRPGLTFNPANYQGLLTGKKLYVITARGGSGYGAGQARANYNLQDGQITTAFGLIGVTDVEFIHVENTVAGDEVREASLADARAKIAEATAA